MADIEKQPERSRARGEGRYGLALGFILASAIVIMAAPDIQWSRALTLFLQGGALAAAVRAAEVSPQGRRVITGVVIVILFLATVLGLVGIDSSLLYVKTTSLILVLIATPIITYGIIKQGKEEGQVTIQTMLGALCIYLLLALAFAFSFSVVEVVSGNPFFGSGQAESTANYLYFSITSITSLGLGDFYPASGLGRALTAAEALIGQIYMVTVVALIIANMGRSK